MLRSLFALSFLAHRAGHHIVVEVVCIALVDGIEKLSLELNWRFHIAAVVTDP